MSSLCSNPDKKIVRLKRKRKTSRGSGRNAGHRKRANPEMELAACEWTIIWPPADITHYGEFQPSFEVSTETKEMWDTHGYIQNWMNPLVQEEFACSSFELEPIFNGDQELLRFQGPPVSPRSGVRLFLPFLSEGQLDELALQSELKLKEVIPKNVSLVNFLWELYTGYGHISKQIKNFDQRINRAIKAFNKEFLRLIKLGYKDPHAKWLAWNFAIKPAISDLKAILCSITATYDTLKWLRDHNHQILTVSYERDLTELSSWDPDERFNSQFVANILKGGSGNGTYWYTVRYMNYKLTYRAKARIFLDIPDEFLTGSGGVGILWSSLMGLYNPIGILWEAIPFSWLADYFLTLRARLWQKIYDYNPYDEGVTVLGYGHSFECTCAGSVDFTNSPPGEFVDDITVKNLGVFKYHLKSREAGLPFPEQVYYFRVPGDWYHASIIGSVATGLIQSRRR